MVYTSNDLRPLPCRHIRPARPYDAGLDRSSGEPCLGDP